jgi:transcription antitermination factor NusG
MVHGNTRVNWFRLAVAFAAVVIAAGTGFAQAAPPGGQAKAVGAIKSIEGQSLVLATDDGTSMNVSLPEGVRVVRIAPGATDLKNATPITTQDLQVGDRVLVRGKASDDAKSLTATTVIVMKQSDLASKQQQEREEWRKNGVGGLVSAVDPAAGTATISVTNFSGTKEVLIQTNKKTVVRRYAANSTKFDDAKPSSLADIHPGDQLRARGVKNQDGTELTAAEIVSGRFRNIAGTVTALNAEDNSVTVMDLLTKQPVTVKIAADSQLRKLPQIMAQRIAMRLKGQTPEGGPPAGGAAQNANATPSGTYGGANGGAGRSGGDLQQMLSRLPSLTLKDFQKGDAVILVSTEGSGTEVTAITMVGGVEPILTASPGSQAMQLSPWSLSGGQADSQ